MLVREIVDNWVEPPSARESDGLHIKLPTHLKSDRTDVRVGMMQRLAASRLFALGDRTGALRSAQRRSGRAFRLDVRQRVIVKALVSRHVGKGAERSAALTRHIVYLGRSGAGMVGARPEVFTRDEDAIQPTREAVAWSGDRHHFRFIISPEHGDRIDDLKSYVREVMGRVAADLGEPDLNWFSTCHFDTDLPHAHVIVRGRRGDGRDLVIPRDYIGYGFRARAQEVAQERLGDLSRVEAERRIWRETQADRFTSFDRRLLEAAGPDGLVEDGVGTSTAWAALTRGRLRHLEGLGLARREGRRYRLDSEMEARLRGLQARRDIIRTLNQRRLEGGRDVRMLGTERLRGAVVRTGFHDEVGATPWVIVRDAGGAEVYARVAPGSVLSVGAEITLQGATSGISQVVGRGRDAGRG